MSISKIVVAYQLGVAAADGVVEVTRSSAPAGATARRAHNVKVDR